MVGFLLCSAVPFGPVGLTCIRRTLASGWRVGFLSVTGAAVADGIFGAIIALGFGASPGFFAGHELLLRSIGGVLLIFMGAYLIHLQREEVIGEVRDLGTWHTSLAMFTTAVVNPFSLASMAVLFGALGLVGRQATMFHSITVASGVFLGSLLWWVVLSGFVDALREKFTPRLLRAINRAIGLILIACGTGVILVWL